MSFSKIYDGLEPMRLNKWLAQSGVCSRREAESLIARGDVFVDGVRVEDVGRKIETGQVLTLGEAGKSALSSKISLIYHKPSGIVSGQPEPGKIPAIRMIRQSNQWFNFKGEAGASLGFESGLAPVGRLDEDSRGLLILSEDGVLAKAIIGPDSELDKEYHVRVRGEITPLKLKWLCHGLELDERKLKPAKVTHTGGQTLCFILQEGRNRQIRRMCELVDLGVSDLFRNRIGPLHIGDLPQGEWRLILPQEKDALIRAGKA